MSTALKTCTKCYAAKPAEDFYRKHSACKECTKSRVRAHYAANRDRYSAYEKERARRPERKAWASAAQKRLRARSPERYRARDAVGNALRDGRLVKSPCEVCGAVRVQAHHEDYSKPLDVRWLCFKHHREVEHGQVVTKAF